jgi:chaperonin GroEL
MLNRRVCYAPEARQALRKGFNVLADAMEVTLGPCGRLVAIERDVSPSKPPELLNDGAIIARRFLGLPNTFETMGAMLARHIAWQVEEEVGDGSTIAVIIARHVLDGATRCIAAGHNPMSLRRGLEKALAVALGELAKSAQPLEAAEQIISLAASITGDNELGRYIEEIFDTVGPQGAVDVRSSYRRVHDREYIQGTFWNQGWISSHLTTDGGKAVVKRPYILLTNRRMSKAAELIPIMDRIRRAGDRGLVVIAYAVEGDALNVLVANKVRQIMPTLGLKAPGLGPEKLEILRDLAVLCGGKVFVEEAGDRVEDATLDDLGQADEAQAIRSGFTIVGGKGSPAAIRQRIMEIRRQLPTAAGRERERLIERAGKLLGGVGLLYVGGATDAERDYLKDRAQEAVRVVRLGLEEGIVPGGGAAFLTCLPALDRLELPADEAVAGLILREALLVPMRAIIRNAGCDPNPIVVQVQEKGPGYGFDVLRGEITHMLAANIVDPVRVLQTALQVGVSGAIMALSTEVLVHKPRSNRDEEVRFTP